MQEQWGDKTQGNYDRGHGEQDAVRVRDPCRAGAGGELPEDISGQVEMIRFLAGYAIEEVTHNGI